MFQLRDYCLPNSLLTVSHLWAPYLDVAGRAPPLCGHGGSCRKDCEKTKIDLPQRDKNGYGILLYPSHLNNCHISNLTSAKHLLFTAHVMSSNMLSLLPHQFFPPWHHTNGILGILWLLQNPPAMLYHRVRTDDQVCRGVPPGNVKRLGPCRFDCIACGRLEITVREILVKCGYRDLCWMIVCWLSILYLKATKKASCNAMGCMRLEGQASLYPIHAWSLESIPFMTCLKRLEPYVSKELLSPGRRRSEDDLLLCKSRNQRYYHHLAQCWKWTKVKYRPGFV